MIWLIIFGSIALLFFSVSLFGAPYVPSHKKRLRDAFVKLYPLESKDVVVDLGSGDGIVLRYASRKGAKAIGYEINPILVLISRVLSFRDQNVSAVVRNFWTTTLPDTTTVIYAFTVSRDIDRLLRYVQKEANRIQKPLVVISYGITAKAVPASASAGAHHRYDVAPLQQEKP